MQEQPITERQAADLIREIRALKAQLRRTDETRGITGWREVRGTHGMDYVRDPNGTATPPWQ